MSLHRDRHGEWFDDRITQIPLRPGVVIKVLDIPHDLSVNEAEKIAAVVQAMVGPATKTPNQTAARKTRASPSAELPGAS